MKKVVQLLLIAVLFGAASPASADMIEVKGKGIMNGTILSDDGKKVQFADGAGNKSVFDKKDVLFAEKQAEPTMAEKIKYKSENYFAERKKNAPPPEPVRAAAPAVAASADATSDQFGGSSGIIAQALQQASQARIAADTQQRRAARAMAEMEGGGSGEPVDIAYQQYENTQSVLDKKNSRFVSLDDSK